MSTLFGPVDRRTFVNSSIWIVVAMGLCSCASEGRSHDGGGGGGIVDVGPLSQYARDGIVDRYAKSNGVMLVTYGGRLTAISSACTRDGSLLEPVKGVDGFVCPKDGSRFDRSGQAREGSAAREPLVHYVLSVNAAGHVLVDTGKPLSQPYWGRTDSYLMAR